MNKIIVTTDFSKESDLSFDLAKVLQDEHSDLCVVHLDKVADKFAKLNLSSDLINSQFSGKEIPTYLVDEIKEQIQRTGFKESDIDFNVIAGSEFEKLAEHLNQFDEKNYIACAVKPVNFWQRVLFGSFVEKLIFSTKHPVILTKKKLASSPKKIAVCFDPVQDSENLLEHTKDFAKRFGAQVDIIYVESFDTREIYQNVFATDGATEKDKNQIMGYKRALAESKFKAYKESFEKAGVDCQIDIVLTVNSDPATDLKNHLNENPVDFIFIEPHPGFRKSFRFNSTSFDLIKNVDENFVVVKEQKDGK